MTAPELPPDWVTDEPPAWGLAGGAERPVAAAPLWAAVDRDWALGGATGAGVRVCILDSGIEATHPAVGGVERSVTVVLPDDDEGEPAVVDDEQGDVSGHGTACAGIVRSLAPEVTIASGRVLGADVNGAFAVLRAGLSWAIEERYDVVNLSLSVRSPRFALALCELADRAAHQGTLLVCSAHNLPVESYPWRFASVVSVGSHDDPDPRRLYWNPEPPVELYARGVGVPIAWPGGGTVTATGNSFAAPHVTGLAALVRSKHPALTPFELKTVLYRIADNVHA
jgi:subtilisin family serine protease